MFNRIYKVYIQAEAPYREHKDNINLFFVKASNGVMVPLTSLGNASYTTGPGSIKRFNMFTTAVIRGEAAHGYSSGQAMEIMEQIAVIICRIISVWNGAVFPIRRNKPEADRSRAGIGFSFCLPLFGSTIRELDFAVAVLLSLRLLH